MTPEQITNAGQDLFQAEKNRKQIKLLTSDYPDMKMDEAYAVQKSLVELNISFLLLVSMLLALRLSTQWKKVF